MTLHNSVSQQLGAPSEPASVQLAFCQTCRTALEQSIDALGRVRDRCPKCQGLAPRQPAATSATPTQPRPSSSAITQELTRMRDEIASLERRNAALESDGRALDWLLANKQIRYGAFPITKRKALKTMIAENGSRPLTARGRLVQPTTCACGATWYRKQGERYHSKTCPARKYAVRATTVSETSTTENL